MRPLVLLVCVALAACDGAQSTPASAPVTAVAYDKDQLKGLLVGKTGEQAIQLLGRPDDVTDLTSGEALYYYRLRSGSHDFTVNDESASGHPSSMTLNLDDQKVVRSIGF